MYNGAEPEQHHQPKAPETLSRLSLDNDKSPRVKAWKGL
jgi:hypothetical protein